MRIAFLTRIQRPFNGETLLREPLGGTQSAMIYLARALAGRGHEPVIFCNGQPGSFDGVSYRPIAELPRFARQQPLDVFVSVAGESDLKLGIPARITLWWSHNDYAFLWDEMPDLRAEIGGLLATRADRLIAVSDWHAAKLQELFKLPPEHFWIGRNGVHWEHFLTEPAPATPPRLLYTSVPDRGLDRLLTHFEAIRAQVPEAELHLYSSFRVWGKDAAWDQARAGEIYARARGMAQVFLHDPLPQPQLALELGRGSLLAYPNQAAEPVHTTGFWAETSCIAALEAQAAGLPVVTSARGALPETVRDRETGLLIPGDPLSETYAKDFVAACVSLLQQPELRQRLGQQARARIQRTYRWEQIAAEWEALLENDFVSTRQHAAPEISPFAAPKISVIIPTYNRSRNLRLCLESLTWQDEKAFEVIVCDDGSSDDTRAVADSFKSRLNLRYRWQQDQGFRAAEARNLGVAAARGKLLLFLDSDLVVPPDFVRSHAEAHARFGKQKIAINSFVWRMLTTDDADLGLPPAEYIPLHQSDLKADTRIRFNVFERGEPVEETYFLDSNAFSIKREDYAQIGGFDGSFVGWGHEDTELGYRLSQFGFRLAFIRADAYHLYHYVAETKDAERAVNWQRLTAKHGISKWYHPLWDLPIEAGVLCFDSGQQLELLQIGSWTLKPGQRAPAGDQYFRLIVENGVLAAIEPIGVETGPDSPA